MVRRKQFNVTNEAITGGAMKVKRAGPKNKKKKKKKKKKQSKRIEIYDDDVDSEESEAEMTEDTLENAMKNNDDEWTPQQKKRKTFDSGDVAAVKSRPSRSRSAKKRKSTPVLIAADGTEWFPQKGDLVLVDFKNETYEAFVRDITQKIVDVSYVVDSSFEYIKRTNLGHRNMRLKRRVEVGSKIRKVFVDPDTGKNVPFKGAIMKVWEISDDESDERMNVHVRYEDGDEEDMLLSDAARLLITN